MVGPKEIHKQITKLTSDLIALSISNNQNYPSMKNIGEGIIEIGLSNDENLSFVLKNEPYENIYNELRDKNVYNIKLIDGALLHLFYTYKKDKIIKHRLAFFPSPNLLEFQNDPDLYLNDEIYADIIMKNLVRFPLRFDFDNDPKVVKEIEHPASHLTLGQYKNCRIPVSSPITPFTFISFILRSFYKIENEDFSVKISLFPEGFEETISSKEKNNLYIKV
jgi:hypothetical protein